MLCEKCRQFEATGVSDVLQGGVKVIKHLCTRCLIDAKNKKNSEKHSEVFGSFAMFSGLIESPSLKLSCKTCGTQLTRINKTLFVGCPDCYNQLTGELNPVIKNIQGATTHIGTSPSDGRNISYANSDYISQIESLQHQIMIATNNKRYDEVSILCNKLMLLEDAAKAGGYGKKGDK